MYLVPTYVGIYHSVLHTNIYMPNYIAQLISFPNYMLTNDIEFKYVSNLHRFLLLKCVIKSWVIFLSALESE